MSEQDRFSYGDAVIFKQGMSGAPQGTKAQFLEAVGSGSALVKITKRIPPSKDRNGDPHYVNGAKVTTRFENLAKDNGQDLTVAPAPEQPWKPAYEPK